MAPVLEMAMVAKLLMILIDTTMMWDVPKKARTSCTTGRWPYIARKLKNLKSSQLPNSCIQITSKKFSGNFGWPKSFPENFRFIAKAVRSQ